MKEVAAEVDVKVLEVSLVGERGCTDTAGRIVPALVLEATRFVDRVSHISGSESGWAIAASSFRTVGLAVVTSYSLGTCRVVRVFQ